MQTYTVHEKRAIADDIEERAGNLVFVKEGFSFWTLLAPALWFLFNGLWRALIVYLVLAIGLGLALTELGFNEQIAGWSSFILNLLFAFEARDIYRGSLERRGYQLRGVVSGKNLEECERRFLMEWLPEAKRERDHLVSQATTGTAIKGEAGPNQTVPVIGMFPAHGG